MHLVSCKSDTTGLLAKIVSLSVDKLVLEMPISAVARPQNFTLEVNQIQTSFEVIYTDEAPAEIDSFTALAKGTGAIRQQFDSLPSQDTSKQSQAGNRDSSEQPNSLKDTKLVQLSAIEPLQIRLTGRGLAVQKLTVCHHAQNAYHLICFYFMSPTFALFVYRG